MIWRTWLISWPQLYYLALALDLANKTPSCAVRLDYLPLRKKFKRSGVNDMPLWFAKMLEKMAKKDGE